MQSKITNQEITANQNKQQNTSNRDIIQEILNLLASNDLSISDAKEILYATTKALYKQKVM